MARTRAQNNLSEVLFLKEKRLIIRDGWNQKKTVVNSKLDWTESNLTGCLKVDLSFPSVLIKQDTCMHGMVIQALMMQVSDYNLRNCCTLLEK